MILVVCALGAELQGFDAGPNVEVLISGVGPVEAAVAAARALALRPFEAVINAGIAGAFPGRGNVGDACFVKEEILADFGLEGGRPLSLPDGAALMRRVRAAPALVELAASLGFPVVRGLTVTQVTTTDATAERLRLAHEADIESMEGFAVFRAAQLAEVPAIGVRGISNIVGDRAAAQWDFHAGSQAALNALRTLLTALAAERKPRIRRS